MVARSAFLRSEPALKLRPQATEQLLCLVPRESAGVDIATVEGVEQLIDPPGRVGGKDERKPHRLARLPEGLRRAIGHVATVRGDGLQFFLTNGVSTRGRLLLGKLRVAKAEVDLAPGFDAKAFEEVASFGVGIADLGQALLDAGKNAAEAFGQDRLIVDGLMIAAGHDHAGVEVDLRQRRHVGIGVDRIGLLGNVGGGRVIRDQPRADEQLTGIDSDRPMATIVSTGFGGADDIRLAGRGGRNLSPNHILSLVPGHGRGEHMLADCRQSIIHRDAQYSRLPSLPACGNRFGKPADGDQPRGRDGYPYSIHRRMKEGE